MSPYITAQLNARLQPVHRGDLFEDPLDEALAEKGLGAVVGGGTAQSELGEVEHGDIEIRLERLDEESLDEVARLLNERGVPKGSKLIDDEGRVRRELGVAEGLAVYLNGTDLPPEVYEQCSANEVYDQFSRLLDGVGAVLSWWQGPSETALYVYGRSFEAMRECLQPFLDTYPLCQRCRVVQVA